MSNKNFLSFIDNKSLYQQVQRVLNIAKDAANTAEDNLYSNVVDPFSAIFDAMHQDIGLVEWLDQEKFRQMQKTLQNSLGEFHQGIIGSMPGWEDLGTGSVVDVRNKKNKVIAEIKNKWNTTKGTDKKSIYDNLESQLDKPTHKGFTGYYVEVIPKSRVRYDKPFTPPDNVTHTKRQSNERIRVMDGKSFYTLASGDPDAIDKLYAVLPRIVGDILKRPPDKIEKDPLFKKLFEWVY